MQLIKYGSQSSSRILLLVGARQTFFFKKISEYKYFIIYCWSGDQQWAPLKYSHSPFVKRCIDLLPYKSATQQCLTGVTKARITKKSISVISDIGFFYALTLINKTSAHETLLVF